MDLTDIAPLDTWARIENEAFEKFGLQSSVFNADGIRITDTKNWANSLCPAIKAIDKGQTFICATAHMNMAHQAQQTRKPVIEECDAGLVKIVVPIFAGDDFIGAAGGCGLLLDDGEVDSFAVNKIVEMEEDRVAALSAGIPAITSETAEEIGRFFAEKIDTLLKRK